MADKDRQERRRRATLALRPPDSSVALSSLFNGRASLRSYLLATADGSEGCDNILEAISTFAWPVLQRTIRRKLQIVCVSH